MSFPSLSSARRLRAAMALTVAIGAGTAVAAPSSAVIPIDGGGSAAKTKWPKDVKRTKDVGHYDDAPAWNGGRNCTSGFTVGAKRLQGWLRHNWGPATIQGFNCRQNTADLSKTSIHGVGRASDWFRDAGKRAHRRQVTAFNRRLSRNGAAQARALGVQYWIWNRRQYSVRGNRVLVRPYGGPNPHTDHVHIEQTNEGARLGTKYWRIFKRIN
ncbi:MAG: hypothetical protein AB7G37_04240 [Solirubrobacteraceae bacterium]